MKCNNSDELKTVFKALSTVRKARGHVNLADHAVKPEHVRTLRDAYLVSLQAGLIQLSFALDKWIDAGAPMERKEYCDEDDINH